MIKKCLYKKGKKEISDMSFNERNKMATHYILNDLDPHYVILGYIENSFFYRLYISIHKQEAKRRNLIKYNEE